MKTANPVCRGRAVVSLLALCVLAASAGAAAPLADISLPPGFSIEVYADDVPNARSMALGGNGTVFVATRRDGRVFAIVPEEGAAPRVITIAEGLNMPNGIAWHDGDLYVAELSRVLRYAAIEADLQSPPPPEVVGDALPEERHHGWRYIAFGPDGKLYITIGAPCNICERDGFGVIVRQNADGSGRETVARGVRNSVGLTWDPATGELWFTDNGRDMLGDNIPPGELNHAPVTGLHFGFPYCHGGDIADPEFGDQGDCADFVAPAQKLGPHVAPLGLTFYSGSMFPAEYRGQIFIAEHGSWNRSRKTGYRVSLVRMHNGVPAGYETFAEGWLQDEQVSGRPVDLLLLEDGSMLVSDDKAGKIYRISYVNPQLQ